MKTERRKWKRYQVRYPLCRMRPDFGGFAAVRDISMNGAMVVGPNLPPIGSAVQLWIECAGHKTAQVLGRVVRHNRDKKIGFAVSFPTPSPWLLKAALQWR
jgi:hypothetical protein